MEAHHAYDDIDHMTQFQPFKAGDTVRVFHGFYALSDAIIAAKVGLSGAERADRRFSYEFNNNPKGLFVTLKLSVAEEFAFKGPIIEFVAAWTDLEAPVWPGNGYTVQGQVALYFGGGATGRADRRRRHRELSADVQQQIVRNPEHLQHVAQSDDPYRAYLLSSGREYQALYIGHLEPQAIAAKYALDPSESRRISRRKQRGVGENSGSANVFTQ